MYFNSLQPLNSYFQDNLLFLLRKSYFKKSFRSLRFQTCFFFRNISFPLRFPKRCLLSNLFILVFLFPKFIFKKILFLWDFQIVVFLEILFFLNFLFLWDFQIVVDQKTYLKRVVSLKFWLKHLIPLSFVNFVYLEIFFYYFHLFGNLKLKIFPFFWYFLSSDISESKFSFSLKLPFREVRLHISNFRSILQKLFNKSKHLFSYIFKSWF